MRKTNLIFQTTQNGIPLRNYMGLSREQHKEICAIGLPDMLSSIQILSTFECKKSSEMIINNLHKLSSSLHLSGFSEMSILLSSEEDALRRDENTQDLAFDRIQTYINDLNEIATSIEKYIAEKTS
jgi:HPt (histidine-containing phosphotransfer) domain-containing protein